MKNSLLLISFIIAIFLSIGFTYQTQGTQSNTPTVTNTVKPAPTNTPVITFIPPQLPTATIQSQASQTSNTGWPTIVTIGIAVLSLFLSITTLILTQLKGPVINLALPDKIYPCQGIAQGPAPIPGKNPFILKTNLLIANTGIRSGVLYYFRVDSLDDDLA